MDILFLHQNFPGQFQHLAPALAARGHRVFALTSRVDEAQTWRGVRVLPYPFEPPAEQRSHPWLNTLNAATHRATAVLRATLALKARGLEPRVIVAHSGWGEGLFLRDVWPDARIGVFAEFFYQAEGADIDFDPEFVEGPEFGRTQRMRMRNLSMRMQLDAADAGISPTRWQADQHPPDLRGKLSVIFDGVDTRVIRPDPGARLTVEGRGSWSRDDEVITFVNRNLEPYRGFHVFMRALPGLLARRPAAQILVVGEDGVSYGGAPKEGGTWRQRLAAEIADRMRPEDWARVHFLGRVERDDFTRLLQVSRVHAYLTYPFVLSWSLMEAMACEAAIVASDTPPVREVLRDGVSALTFDFFDPDAMTDRICTLLDDAPLRAQLGAAARARVAEDYDLADVCLPRQFAWIEALARGG